MCETGLCLLLNSQVISEHFLAITTNSEKCSVAVGIKKTYTLRRWRIPLKLAISLTLKKLLFLNLFLDSGPVL